MTRNLFRSLPVVAILVASAGCRVLERAAPAAVVEPLVANRPLVSAEVDSCTPAVLGLPLPPAPPMASPTGRQVRRYRRAMRAYAEVVRAHQTPQPAKVKMTGAAVYAAPGSTVTAATGKGSAAADSAGLAVAAGKRGPEQQAVTRGDGNAVAQQPAPAVGLSWWWLVLVGLGWYLVTRNRA